MRVRGKFLIAALVCLLAAGSLMAQTTRGTISGTVVDEGGQALPGVTVVLTSPAIQAQKSAVTDANGKYRFVLLPTGTYKATFALPGYQRVEQENIALTIGGNVVFKTVLKSAFTEEVVVSGQAPLVDTTSTTVGVNLNKNFFLNLPTGRNYASVASVTPGAQADASGQTFYGSTGAENAYYIDGANTTGVELGQQGKTLNFEFIKEVQVKTGGYNAEYGRNTGGIINVITKSGGNEFHGDVFGYYDSDSLQNDLSPAAEAGAQTGTTQRTGFTREDFGADIGGYILKDKIWFFAAYDYVDNTDTLASLKDFTSVGGPVKGQEFDDETTRDLFAAKLTWRISENHSVAASIFGDPTEDDGLVGSLASPPTHYLGKTESGGTDSTFNYDGVFGENWVVSLRFAQHKEKFRQAGAGTDIPGYIDFTDPLGDGTITWGWNGTGSGFGFYQNQDFTRQQYNGDVSYFVNDFFGQHEIKAGYEYEHIRVNNQNFNGGTGQRIYRFPCSAFRCPPGQDYYYRHRYFVKSKIDPTQATLADLLNPLAVKTKADNDAAYLQDRWQVSPTLTLNVGLRWDRQKLFNALGEVNANIGHEWGPRLGFVWDFMGNGKSKLYGHYGRFYETIPMDIVIRSFGGEITVFSYNYSDNPNDVAGLPLQTFPTDTSVIGRRSSTLGGGFSRVDPATKGQYITEWVLGGEYEVAPNLSIGIKGIYRDLGRVIEDALTEDLDYFIGNPGRGQQKTSFEIGIWYNYLGCPDGTNDCHRHPTVPPKRTFTGIEVDINKRFSNNFQFIASALWSRLYGNYDGTFQASTGQLDPNLNSAYDYYDFSVNNDGYLSNDRRQQYKFDGTYKFDWGLSVGLSLYYRTGTPVTAMGYSTAYNNWEYYLSRRGAFGRTNSEWEGDLHLGYPIKIANGWDLNFLVDVFNLFNRQKEAGRDLRYDLVEDYQPIDWSDGTPLPALTPANALIPVENKFLGTNGPRPATLDSFNTTNRWQAPREIRLGVRLSF